MKRMIDMSLYDLMAEDLDVWVGVSEFGFKFQIDDAEGNALVDEASIHPYAAESFADFCKRYLVSYERACLGVLDHG